jgi:GH24 family phage-related lysozyme (muramidase)
MAIPTNRSKRKGSPVEKPGDSRVKQAQRAAQHVMNTPVKQKFDNQPVRDALKSKAFKRGVKKFRDSALNTMRRVKLP